MLKRILAATAGAVVMMGTVAAMAQETTFTIGCSLPLSGRLVGFGEQIKLGAEVAIDEMNASPLAKGIKFKLECFDSKGDPKETINIAQRLIDRKNVIASISDFTSSATMAAAETYKNGELVQITPTASHPDITRLNPWMFRAYTTIPIYVPPTADLIVNKLKHKRVAVVQVQTDWGAGVGKAFADEVTKLGGEVVSHDIYNEGHTDFRSVLTQIRRKNPDVIFLAMLEEEAVNFLKQRQQFGMATAVVDSSLGVTPRSIELAGSAMNGVLAMTLFSEQIENPVMKEFARRFRERNGKTPDVGAACGYDAARLIMEAAIRAYPNITRASVRDEMSRTVDFNGANGALSIDRETREISRKATTFVQVADGKLILFK